MSAETRRAWATLVMRWPTAEELAAGGQSALHASRAARLERDPAKPHPSYVSGALVLARSLREAGTRADLVAMVTPDVPGFARAALAAEFDRVVEVEYLRAPAGTSSPLSETQRYVYGRWIADSPTKWRALGLTDWDLVAFVDADVMALPPGTSGTANPGFPDLRGCDGIFALRAPAATFASPWARPQGAGGRARGFTSVYGRGLAEGDAVPAKTIRRALDTPGAFAPLGSLVLLEPSARHAEDFPRSLPWHRTKIRASGVDETSLADYFAGHLGRDWTHVSMRRQAHSWRPPAEIPTGPGLPAEIPTGPGPSAVAVHYFGKKPWLFPRGRFPDLAAWREVADRIAAARPGLAAWFAEPAEQPAAAPDSAGGHVAEDAE